MSKSITFIEYTPATEQAIKRMMNMPPLTGIKSHHIPVPKQQFIGNTPPQQQKAVSGYNGYFKLILNTVGEGQYQVSIIDGAYQNTSNPLSARSYCYVNRTSFYVNGWQSPVFSDATDTMFLLKATIGIDYSTDYSTVEIVSMPYGRIPDGTNTTAWYLLGRLLFDKNKQPRIVQDHQSGVPQMLWFSSCELEADNDSE